MDDRGQPLPLLLRPMGRAEPSRLAAAVIPLLALSAALILVAAWAMPEGYAWRLHSISESAAQGLRHGWIARLAFLCFGAAVLMLALSMRPRWPRATTWCQLAFAGAMFGAAAFSHAPWLPGVANDAVEDLLHTVSASGMGFAFSAGVVARFLQRGPGAVLGRAFDAVALALAVAVPMLLASASSVGGMVQRIMFVVAYLWFGREALIALGVVDERAAG